MDRVDELIRGLDPAFRAGVGFQIPMGLRRWDHVALHRQRTFSVEGAAPLAQVTAFFNKRPLQWSPPEWLLRDVNAAITNLQEAVHRVLENLTDVEIYECGEYAAGLLAHADALQEEVAKGSFEFSQVRVGNVNWQYDRKEQRLACGRSYAVALQTNVLNVSFVPCGNEHYLSLNGRLFKRWLAGHFDEIRANPLYADTHPIHGIWVDELMGRLIAKIDPSALSPLDEEEQDEVLELLD